MGPTVSHAAVGCGARGSPVLQWCAFSRAADPRWRLLFGRAAVLAQSELDKRKRRGGGGEEGEVGEGEGSGEGRGEDAEAPRVGPSRPAAH